jgi:hypothetical protein
MTKVVKSVGKEFGRATSKVAETIGMAPEVSKPYNPLEDPAYLSAQQDAAADRARVRTEQDKLAAEQRDALARSEAERRDLASQSSSRQRARRYGGMRALLSSERLAPEVGLNKIDPLA